LKNYKFAVFLAGKRETILTLTIIFLIAIEVIFWTYELVIR